MKKIFFLH